MSQSDKQFPVTLRDIAQVVGVSHVTVSLALRNNPKIPEERRLQIQSVAQNLGYRPNAMAAALASCKRPIANAPIQAALAWLNQWPQPGRLRSYIEFDRYWQGARAAAEKFGYRLEEFVCGQPLSLPRLEKILMTRGIRGILLPPQPTEASWSKLHWEHFSAVRFGRTVQSPRMHIVSSDQVANSALAYTEMQRRGYRRIGFVTGQAAKRGGLFKAGYLFAQEEARETKLLPICTIEESESASSQKSHFARWLRAVKPDAILTDVAQTRELLANAGCRAPEDVGLAVMSILDGGADAGIDQHSEEIGRVAVLIVLSLMHDNAYGVPPIFRQVLIEGSWVDGSTLPDRR
jgi:LacI family transcriptional regulator